MKIISNDATILAISYNDLATTVPFENSIDTFDLRGDHLKDLFEYAVKGSWQTTVFDGKFFTQVSGMTILLENLPKQYPITMKVYLFYLRD